MKKILIQSLVALAAVTSISAFAQGSLTPSGAPAPSMKSLAQVEPRTPISAASFTISQPGSYYLTTNLTGFGSAPGVTIAANDVTLDLNGFAMTGPAVVYAGVFVGSGSYTNVTIRNGTIKGWIEGVRVFDGDSKNIVLDQLNISDSAGYGIDAAGATITRCTVTASGNTGIYAYYSLVQNCTVNYSRATGIELRASDAIGCEVNYCNHDGIRINFAGCQVIANTLRSNNLTNGVNYASIRINDNYNRIENNHISNSGAAGAGIGGGLGYSGNIVIRNSVIGGGVNDYSIIGNQIVGPIINTSGTITNVNPWANFAY
ncbi:MAG: right-handed parallel beta-helix repeat-containing protein [Verrucomicrobiota bacterium]